MLSHSPGYGAEETAKRSRKDITCRDQFLYEKSPGWRNSWCGTGSQAPGRRSRAKEPATSAGWRRKRPLEISIAIDYTIAPPMGRQAAAVAWIQGGAGISGLGWLQEEQDDFAWLGNRPG